MMKQTSEQNDKKYPQGHFINLWIGLGVAIFSCIGVPISIASGNHGFMGIGPAIGISIGYVIGQSIEDKYKKAGRIRPLTAQEKKIQKVITYVLLGLGFLILCGVIITFFFIF